MRQNKDLEAFYAWLNGNRFPLNVAKAQSMTFVTKYKQTAPEGQDEHLNLEICNETLEIVQCTKYLGTHIDNSLDWKKDIQEISIKL